MKSRIAVVAMLALLVLAASGCVSSSTGTTVTEKGSVEGWVYQNGGVYTVTDSSTAPGGYSAVQGAAATVQGTSLSSTTDAQGHFRIDNVNTGSVILAVATSNWAGRIPVTVAANTVAHIPASGTKKAWTVMLYGVTDQSLISEIEVIKSELETVGTNAQINIIFQVGQYDGVQGHPGNAQRLIVDPASANGTVKIQDLGDLDMGNKDTLKTFVDWAWANYPADHHMLVTYSHGNGWYIRMGRNIQGRPGFSSPIARIGGKPTRGILYDFNHNDNVDVDEFGLALSGKHFDYIVLDHCITQTIEAAYELVGVADYVAGSEALAARYDFSALVTKLNGNPNDPMAAVQAMGDAYVKNMNGWQYPATFSILKESGIVPLANALSEMASAATANNTTLTNIATTVATGSNTQIYSELGKTDTSYDYADIYDLAYNIANGAGIDATTKTKAQAILAAVPGAVVFNRCGNGTISPLTGNAADVYPVDKSHGLMVAYPSMRAFNTTSTRYYILGFAVDTTWDTFLDARGQKL